MFHVEHSHKPFLMKNIFNSVLMPKVKTNSFDLSHDVKMSGQMGKLIPSACYEAIPGDYFEFSNETFVRMMPMLAPIMHRVDVTTHCFFTPNRLLWPEWEDWITGKIDTFAPFIEISEVEIGSLMDYLGYPTGTFPEPIRVSPMPIAAYLKQYDEYYRDQNLQPELFSPLVAGDNNDNYAAYALKATGIPNRAWQHDYFTSGLPFAQAGDEVTIPLVIQNDIPVQLNTGIPGNFKTLDGDNADNGTVQQLSGPSPYANSTFISGEPVAYDPRGGLTVDVQADAASINDLRSAWSLQAFLERAARGGRRYIEFIQSMFDVRSSDARLQRPEYIYGVTGAMAISEVLQTAETVQADVVTSATGTMAGHGVSVNGGYGGKYFCEEHGYIQCIVSVRPKSAYQQGLHRQFTRFTPTSYAFPDFANLGEQPVLNKEVYAAHTEPDGTFSYVPRYSEYKYMDSRVAGEMRSSLAFWHLGRIFDGAPALNSDFIQCRPIELTRIFAVTDPDEDHLLFHIYNRVRVRRKLPRYGIPSTL